MELFISWSGERSKVFATHFCDFLEKILPQINPWMSAEDIQKGMQWHNELNSQLSKNTIGIICVTPENQSSPWLMFEAGALFKTNLDNERIIPVIIGMEPSDILPPLSQFQGVTIDKEDFYKLIVYLNIQLGSNKLNEIVLQEAFDSNWDAFYSILEEKLNNIQFQSSSQIFPKILEALKKNGLPKPEIGTTVQFKEGFESHIIYDSIFKIASNRLYIFGRKNRKVFDKEHWWFFENLNERISQGFDFKCLFLDTESPELVINIAHGDSDFKEQLNECVEKARTVLRKFNIDPEDHIRIYNTTRAYSIVTADEAVLFKPIEFDWSGKAERLTRSSFSLTSSTTSQGSDIVDYFLHIWNISKPFNLSKKL